jgi:general secretion pathway protein C
MMLAPRYRLAIELALLALVAYLAALGVSLGVRSSLDDVPPAPAEAAPVPAAPAPLAEYAVIAERDIFNPHDAGDPATRAPAGALRLFGVALDGPEARAVIEDAATGRQDLYRVGDPVGGARIAAIDWDRVTLERAGNEEVLELAPRASAPEEDAAGGERAPLAPPASGEHATDQIRRVSENAYIVDRREIAGAADNMSGLLTQLRAVAEVHDGRPAGFRLFQIRAGSLFARLGLRDGDVVERVNGTAIGEPAALLGFLQRLGDERRVALDIVRGDAPRTLVYDLR